MLSKIKWLLTPLITMIVGCTITITPLPQNKPIKRHAIRKKHVRPHESPTPVPIYQNKRALDLEPTDKPTPIITIPEKLGTATLISAEKIITF